MDKESFRHLFSKNVDAAIARAEEILGQKIPLSLAFELHGAGYSGVRLGLDDVIDRLYISDSEFYRIIDILVKTAGENEKVIFVRASGHKPASFEQTWNTPEGNGPFKLLEPLELR